MEEIAQPLRELTGFPFNAVLANYYRNGQDSMGWHSDDEPEMDTDLIASVTFGGARAFKFRSKQSGQVISINLLDRSLLLMHHMQKDWQHALPKTRRNNQPRINLTFRRIV
jgi:alkylated DNA repair dioxygenase AlkB